MDNQIQNFHHCECSMGRSCSNPLPCLVFICGTHHYMELHFFVLLSVLPQESKLPTIRDFVCFVQSLTFSSQKSSHRITGAEYILPEWVIGSFKPRKGKQNCWGKSSSHFCFSQFPLPSPSLAFWEGIQVLVLFLFEFPLHKFQWERHNWPHWLWVVIITFTDGPFQVWWCLFNSGKTICQNVFGHWMEENVSLLLRSRNCVRQCCSWLCFIMQVVLMLLGHLVSPKELWDPGNYLGTGIREYCTPPGLKWRHSGRACQLFLKVAPVHTLPKMGPGLQKDMERKSELGLSAWFRALSFWIILKQVWPLFVVYPLCSTNGIQWVAPHESWCFTAADSTFPDPPNGSGRN